MASLQDILRGNPLAKHRDALVILAIVGIVIIMVVPIPTFMLDICLAMMISIALLVLMISMYLESVLEFSVFPGLLLVITLFRLSLNIASTRLILADGEAGEVIRAFGEFVTAGNLVVGIIIFIILVVIQFVVITKGSTRIAEVAARFTLDAMPGKQMAVDADLNAGIITEEEAKTRRKDISREADFYGAMDGASKFVRGDAVAGLIITVINVVGGIVLGVAMQGMPLLEAMETFTKLTIGDGLVSQIPALMISTASGVIVTRAASKNNLGAELIAQFTQSSKSLAVSAFVMAVLGVIPGMPTVPFLLLAASMGFIAYRISYGARSRVAKEEAAKAKIAADTPPPPREERIEDYLLVDQMELEIGYGLIPLVDVNQGGDLLERITMLRRQMAGELGMIVPPIRIRDNIQLNPNEYVIKIKGVDVGRGELMMGSYLAMNPGNVSQRIPGIKTVEPAFGLAALWITESQKESAELAGYTVVELPAVLATHLTELIRRHASEIMVRQDVKTLVDNVKKNSPAVVDELTPSLMSLGEIQQVLSNLLMERVSIRDLAGILELMANAAKLSKDIVFVTEQVRLGLARQICRNYKSAQNQISVITLDPELEQLLEASLQGTNRGPRLVLRPDLVGRILDRMASVQDKVLAVGEQPVMVCSPNIRFPLKKLLESSFPNLAILSYSEIVPGVNITALEALSIHEN